ncbi:MAG TPA: alpha/beta hydrolase, partial [Gemmataceae bacterium]
WNHAARLPPASWFLPRRWRVSNAEMFALRDELERLSGRLKEIRCPVTILHGRDDWLVPPRNAEYLRDRLTGAKRVRLILLANARHKLPLTREPDVRRAIAGLAREVEGAAAGDAGPTKKREKNP